MPSSGCPAVSGWTALKTGWPVGTASGVPATPRSATRRRRAARPANKLGQDRAWRSRRATRTSSTPRSRRSIRNRTAARCRHSARERHAAASSGCGARRTAARAGRRSPTTTDGLPRRHDDSRPVRRGHAADVVRHGPRRRPEQSRRVLPGRDRHLEVDGRRQDADRHQLRLLRRAEPDRLTRPRRPTRPRLPAGLVLEPAGR